MNEWKDWMKVVATVIGTLVVLCIYHGWIGPTWINPEKTDIQFVGIDPGYIREQGNTTLTMVIENKGKKTANDVVIYVETKGFELENSTIDSPYKGYYFPKKDILKYTEQTNVSFTLYAPQYNPKQEYSIDIYCWGYKRIFRDSPLYLVNQPYQPYWLINE